MRFGRALFGAVVVLGSVAASAAMAADQGQLTVVELFQSQGCSSCPPANANVMALSDRPDLLVLSFGVTYWDQLGWNDTFASPQYTARQWDYARTLHHSQVWTPQVVVNGDADVVGIDRRELETLIGHEVHAPNAPTLHASSNQVTIEAGSGSAAQVLLVRYDPNIVQIPIRRGENGGKTLPHKNVVKELVVLGAWSGKSQSYTLPPARVAGLKAAVLVQDRTSGRILTAARL
ncbi:MAG: DUF1223 domain-containing protein [Beijerinckiaceae bacterium]|nr:DUF1223 domain-containing protein [Beijerinckiaceae bacterium]